MKNKCIKTFLAFLCCCSIVTPALADTQNVTTTVGNKTSFVSNGSSAQTSSGSGSNTTSTSSGGTSTQYTQAQLTAINAKKGLRATIQNVLNKARNEADKHGLYSSPNSSIQGAGYQFSSTQFTPSQIASILKYLDQFHSVQNQDENNANYNVISPVMNPIFGNNNMPQLTFQAPTYEDGGEKIALMDKNGNVSLVVNACDAPADGMADSYQGATNLDGNTVDAKLFEQATQAMAKKLKLNFDGFFNYADYLQDSNGVNYLLKFGNTLNPPIDILHGKGTPYSDSRNSMGGVRPDLINGGFHAYYTLTDKFHSFYRFSGTNAMNDYCTVGYIKDYHIENITRNVITDVSHKSNVRRWVVTKDGGSQVVMQTDNPQHQFDFTAVDPGEYTITAYQKVTYTVATQIKYDICEYLFDPVTKGLLYFNEKTVANGTGGTVNMGKVTKEGYVATGDVFRVHVNDLGQVQTTSPSTNRIE